MRLARSFPDLVNRLRLTQHDGNLLAMQQQTHIPYSTLWRWLHGAAEQYRADRVGQLCASYDLDRRAVQMLIHEDVLRRIEGGPVYLPNLSDVKRGPAFQYRRTADMRDYVTSDALAA